jgi:hypothetical protein
MTERLRPLEWTLPHTTGSQSVYPGPSWLSPRDPVYVSSRISMYTYSTGEGITPGGTVDDAVAEATEEVVDDSEINENIDIMEKEKRDFDDVEGIESESE